jgi:hypothetical protein
MESCTHVSSEGLQLIRYVLALSIIIFLQEVLCIFFPFCTCIYSGIWPQMNPVHVYIRAFNPQMNISVLHNMVYRANF